MLKSELIEMIDDVQSTLDDETLSDGEKIEEIESIIGEDEEEETEE